MTWITITELVITVFILAICLGAWIAGQGEPEKKQKCTEYFENGEHKVKCWRE